MKRHECSVALNSVEGAGDIVLIKAHHRAKKDILDATAEFCAVDLRPHSIVEGEGFRALAQLLVLIGDKYGKVDIADLLSDPRSIKKRISELADIERADLYPRVRAAAEAHELAATLDMWAEDTTKQSVMTCNVAFPELNSDTNEWEAKTYNFFTEPFPKDQPKTADNLKAFILKMFANRGVSEENIKKVCFVTDGEAALKNALNKWWWGYCSAHAYNIVYTHAMTVAPKDFQSLPVAASDVAMKVEEIVADLRKLRKGKVGLKIIKDANLVFPKTFTRVSCVSFVADSFVKRFFEDKNRDVVKEADRLTKLDNIDKQLLDELIELLIPLKRASTEVQTKFSVTAQLPLVAYYRLRIDYSPNPGDSETISEMRKRLHAELEHVVKLSETNKVAAFFDPTFRSFRNMLTDMEKTEVYDCVRGLLAELDAAAEDAADVADADPDSDSATAPPAKRAKYDPYAAFRDEESAVLSVADEVKAYLDEPLGEYDKADPKPLAWWQRRADKFPRLVRLARRYLIIPASSAESERTFSDAGWILNKRRKNLDMCVVDDLLFLHCNFIQKLRIKMQNLRLCSSLHGNGGQRPN
ncbi:hypothetical protein FOCC_FOCC017600 [Frankliniella occidentalis]|nr:hypothetical protein FOCC_FOCC017600 [Frankliniella occidentalis]